MSTPARPATRPGFAETLTALERAQKPGHGVPAYTRWVNRRVARYFAAAAVAMGITPNGVTAISAVCSAAGILTLLLAPPTALTALAVALLFALGYGLDSADGQVARVTGASLTGAADGFPSGWSLWWLPMAFTVLTAGHFMSQILAEQLRNNRKTAAPSTGGTMRSFINLHMDAGTLCWIFIVWGFGPLFVVVYALLFAANAATVLLSMRRKYVTLSTPTTPAQ